MGCDIHVHVEVKKAGKWLHYSAPHVVRNYALFAKMAGVRAYDDEIQAIAPVRGIPDDVSDVTRICWENEGDWCHDASYLTRDEMETLSRWYSQTFDSSAQGGHHGFEGVFGYLDGNPIHALGDGLFEDARIVFWFDN